MKLNELPKTAELKARKRVGRGPGSGLGKTAGTGENGQKSRSGVSIKPWFQGGQSPIYRRIPKRGFNNARFTTRYAIINVGDLNTFFKDGDVVSEEILKERGIIKNRLCGIKVLGNGTLDKKLTVKATIFTTSAISKIEDAGGKAEVI